LGLVWPEGRAVCGIVPAAGVLISPRAGALRIRRHPGGCDPRSPRTRAPVRAPAGATPHHRRDLNRRRSDCRIERAAFPMGPRGADPGGLWGARETAAGAGGGVSVLRRAAGV